MKEPNNAPLYVIIYTKLTTIARKHGYALAVHGSCARDFDLVCVPWIEDPADPKEVVAEFTARFDLRVIQSPVVKLHNRWCYTLSFGADVFLDLSFMPRSEPQSRRAKIIEQCDRDGAFVTLEDGFLYWGPNRLHGVLSASHLRTLADELDRRNHEWVEQIEKDLDPK